MNVWAAGNHPQGRVALEQGGVRGHIVGCILRGHAHRSAWTCTFSNKNEDATLQALTGGAETAGVCRIYPKSGEGLKV